MSISAEDLVDAMQDFDYINLDLTEDFLDKMVRGLNHIQGLQKTSYEQSWNLKIDSINRLIEQNRNFRSIVEELIQPIPSETLLPAGMTNNQFHYDMAEFENTPGMKLIAADGEYKKVPEGHIDYQLVNCLNTYLDADIDAVIEFGAGWGKNLSLLQLRSGRADVEYMACEQSESGRSSFERLFACGEDLEYSSHPFDFYAPDFQLLHEKRNVLAFTSAAIEQIAFLPRTFTSGLFDCVEKITFVVLEPIGWQRFIERSSFAVKAYFEEVGGMVTKEDWHENKYTFTFTNDRFHDNAVSWSIMLRYNINLLNLLKSVIDSGEARLLGSKYDICGENPMNPYSLFVLAKN
jgi:hypothetical protein